MADGGDKFSVFVTYQVCLIISTLILLLYFQHLFLHEKSVNCGMFTILILTKDGNIYSSGTCNNGQLGLGVDTYYA